MSVPQRILVYLLRRDLRVADNPVFHEIANLNKQSQRPFTHLLPIYVFPADQVEVSGFLAPDVQRSPYQEARSQVGGFWRCGRLRAKFLAECVWDVKKDLESIGSGLEVRAGALQDVVHSVLEGYRDREDAEVCGVWMTSEEGWEEKYQEDEVRALLEKEDKEFKLCNDEKYYIDEYVAVTGAGRVMSANVVAVATCRFRTHGSCRMCSRLSARQWNLFETSLANCVRSLKPVNCLLFLLTSRPKLRLLRYRTISKV